MSCGGGSRTRTRTLFATSAHGGEACPHMAETEPCSTHPCAIDCVLDDWGAWGGCSVTCGLGTRVRSRTVVEVARFGGAACGTQHAYGACHEEGCPVHCSFEYTPWGDCSRTCGTGVETRDVVVTQQPANGGDECPDMQQRLCNTFVCHETGAPTMAPTPAPPTPAPVLPVAPTPPSAQPLLALACDDEPCADLVYIEARKGDLFEDQGANCTDPTDGDISDRVVVSGIAFPKLSTCIEYTIQYDCSNVRGAAAPPLTRTVRVEDTTCPVCTMHPGPDVVEASFDYIDPGANCTDSLDGSVQTIVTNTVDTSSTGTYTVTYRAEDAAGNFNDASCAGSQSYVRTVTVVDTLKPVIALHYANNIIKHGDASDTAVHDATANPAGAYFSSTSMMALDDTGGGRGALWAAGASCVLGIAALLLSGTRGTRTPELPL